MPEAPIEYIRVKDKDTGHKYTIVASALDEEHQQVLKQDALDHNDNPLPPEFSEASEASSSGQSATTKEK